MTVDDLDSRILAELQSDGRRPFREIGRRLDVSERTVRTRVRRLQDSGALRILAFIDPLELGMSVMAMLLLRIESEAHDRIVATLTSWPEVSYVSTLMGRADIYAQVICRDNASLWDLVTRRLGPIAGVRETETMIEMRVHKFSYARTNGGK